MLSNEQVIKILENETHNGVSDSKNKNKEV